MVAVAVSGFDLSNIPIHECWVMRDWKGRKAGNMGCLCQWDDEGSPVGGEHGPGCPWGGAHRTDCDGTCDQRAPKEPTP